MQDAISAATITLNAVVSLDTTEPERVMGIRAEGRTAVVIMYSLLIYIIAVVRYALFGSFEGVR